MDGCHGWMLWIDAMDGCHAIDGCHGWMLCHRWMLLPCNMAMRMRWMRWMDGWMDAMPCDSDMLCDSDSDMVSTCDSDILGGDSDILGGDSDILGGDSDILGGDSNILGGDSNILGGINIRQRQLRGHQYATAISWGASLC